MASKNRGKSRTQHLRLVQPQEMVCAETVSMVEMLLEHARRGEVVGLQAQYDIETIKREQGAQLAEEVQPIAA